MTRQIKHQRQMKSDRYKDRFDFYKAGSKNIRKVVIVNGKKIIPKWSEKIDGEWRDMDTGKPVNIAKLKKKEVKTTWIKYKNGKFLYVDKIGELGPYSIGERQIIEMEFGGNARNYESYRENARDVMGIEKSKNKFYSTDSNFAIDTDDMQTFKKKDFTNESSMWLLKVGDKVTYRDTSVRKTFKGKVIGFGNWGQVGREMFIETKPGRVIWIDALDGGASGKILKATRNRKRINTK